jgi:hypothetical protein
MSMGSPPRGKMHMSSPPRGEMTCGPLFEFIYFFPSKLLKLLYNTTLFQLSLFCQLTLLVLHTHTYI